MAVRRPVASASLLTMVLLAGCSARERRTLGEQEDARASHARVIGLLYRLGDFAPHLHADRELVRNDDAFVLPGARLSTRVSASGVATISLGEHAWLEIAPEGIEPFLPSVHGNAAVARAGTDAEIVHVLEEDRYEELRVLRSSRAEGKLRWTLRHGVGLTLRARGHQIEALDRDGRVALSTPPLFAVDACGSYTFLDPTLRQESDHVRLELEVDPSRGCLPLVVDPAWVTSLKYMSVTRSWHTATVLPSGKVLLVGESEAPLASPELFDGVGFTSAGSPPGGPRRRPTATWVPSISRVVVVGGNTTGGSSVALSTADMYDPATNTWTALPDTPGGPRTNHVAALLPNVGAKGSVLVAGGQSNPHNGSSPCAGCLKSAYMLDADTLTWSSAGNLSVERALAVAVTLKSGKVLIAGGNHPVTGVPLSSVDLFDGTGWTYTLPSMSVGRLHAVATMLADGRALVAFGQREYPLYSGTAEVFNETTSSWSSLGGSVILGWASSITTTASGKTYAAGGYADGYLKSTAVISGSTLATSDPLNEPRSGATATYMPSVGKILVAGGNQDSVYLSTVELYGAGFGGPCAADCLGHCVDGVCCDAPCDGGCMACTAAKKGAGTDGICGPAKAGSTAKSGCTDSGVASCGDNGKCNGAGACQTYAGATCRAASCNTATNKQTAPATCTSTGACPAVIETPCGAYKCGATACKATCSSNADCSTGYECIGSACVIPPAPEAGVPDADADADADTSVEDDADADAADTNDAERDDGVSDEIGPPTETGTDEDADVGSVDIEDTLADTAVGDTFSPASGCAEGLVADPASGLCVDGVPQPEAPCSVAVVGRSASLGTASLGTGGGLLALLVLRRRRASRGARRNG